MESMGYSVISPLLAPTGSPSRSSRGPGDGAAVLGDRAIWKCSLLGCQGTWGLLTPFAPQKCSAKSNAAFTWLRKVL